jgi:hypothetical protein
MDTLFKSDLQSEIQNNENELIYAITVADLQFEAINRIGRELTEEEIHIAKKGLDFGIGTGLNIIYDAIFDEMIEK